MGDQPDDIEAQVRELVYEYVQKPNSIILAVTPANVDLANSDALKISREVDPSGSRTIGVLTKLDLMDTGTDALEILQNRSSFLLKLGFIGVVNRSQHDINLNRPVADAIKSEMDFFRNHQQYRALVPRCGSAYLARELNKILLEHIREQLPGLKSRINQLIVSTQTELQSYGDLGLPGKTHRGSLLLKLVSTYVTDFQEALQGTLRSSSTSSEPMGGARINQIFNEIYVKTLNGIDSTTGLTPIDVRNAIRNSTGPRPSLFVPEASFEVLTKQQIALLNAPAYRCVDLVSEELQRLAARVERRELLRFPVLARLLVQATAELVKDCLVPTLAMVDNLLKIESAYINTNHADFWKTGSAISTLAKIMEDRRRRESGQMAATTLSRSSEEVAMVQAPLSPVSPTGVKPLGQGGPAAQRDEGGLLSYLFRGSPPQVPNGQKQHEPKRPNRKTHSPHSALPSPTSSEEAYPLNDLSEKEEVETRLIISLLHSYFGIVRKNLSDSVPKAIMHFLVNQVSEQLPTTLVTELYKEDRIDEVLQEDEAVVRQRERCKTALEAYRQAATLLAQVRDTDLAASGQRI